MALGGMEISIGFCFYSARGAAIQNRKSQLPGTDGAVTPNVIERRTNNLGNSSRHPASGLSVTCSSNSQNS